MKTRLLMAMAAASLVLAGCSNNENEEVNNGPVELRLASGVTLQTRADTQAKQILDGEQVYVWVDEANTPPVIDYIKAWSLAADGSGTFTGDNKYFPESGSNVDIYALHGDFGSNAITAGTTAFPSSLTHTVASDQTPGTDGSMASYAKSDLLYAAQKGVDRVGASSNVKIQSLTFYHILSKIEVALQTGTGTPDLDDAVITIENTRLKATFTPDKTKDLADAGSGQPNRAGMIKPTDSNNEVAPITIGNATSADLNNNPTYNEAIIVPQTVGADGETQFIKVQLKGKAALYYKVNNETFESGKKYTYKISVNLTGLQVTSTITDWSSVGAKTGNAEME